MSNNTEDELREDLSRATRALERLAAANATLSAQRDQLAADLVYAEQGVSTWAGAAVKRMQERDAALAAAADLQKKLDAATLAYEDEKKRADHASGQFRAIDMDLNKMKFELAKERMARQAAPERPAPVLAFPMFQPGESVSILDVIEAQYGREQREKIVTETIEHLRASGESVGPLPSVRSVVLRFAIEMERTLRDNDDKGGWDEEDLDDLLDSLKDEVKELSRAVAGDDGAIVDSERVRAEAVDVANFAMMLADRSSSMGKGLPADLQADLATVLGRKAP